MTKKDYEAFAESLQDLQRDCAENGRVSMDDVLDVMSDVFRRDNARFDAARFRAACRPGANVKARGARR